MNEIDMHDVSDDFARCWKAACQHIHSMAQGPLHSWLKANLNPPFLEHFSFRLGNQLFFIRIEDADGRLTVPGSRAGLLSIAEGCKGHPCLMPMQRWSGDWEVETAGWGLIDLRTGRAIDPIALVSDERIEMTDWELQDFAVQVVRDQLAGEGRTLMSWQGNPAVNPSIWFVGDHGPEWVVVRAARYPQREAARPSNWAAISESCEHLGKIGHFASVAVANAKDSFQQGAPAKRLWRGHGMCVRYTGLEPGAAA